MKFKRRPGKKSIHRKFEISDSGGRTGISIRVKCTAYLRPQDVIAMVAFDYENRLEEEHDLLTRKQVLTWVAEEADSLAERFLAGATQPYYIGADGYAHAYRLVDRLFPEWRITETCESIKEFTARGTL